MRRSRLAGVGATAAALAAATTLLMTPANADTAVRHDARNDAPGHIDLTRAVIDNGDTNPDLAIMRIRVDGTLQIGDNVTVWFNRNLSNPGPELRLRGFVDSEFVLHRVNTFNGPGQPTNCDHYSMKQIDDNHAVRVRIDRSCLGNGAVRAAIRTQTDNAVDWFHRARTFLPAVAH